MNIKTRLQKFKKPTRIVIVLLSILLITSILGVILYMAIPINLKIDFDSIVPVQNNVILLYDNEHKTQALAKVDNQGNITDQPFKILSFTDLHLDTYRKKTAITMEMMINNIKREQPDMVVFVGDIITSSNNRVRLKQFCEVMEQFGVYWCTVLGNHEGDNFRSLSREKMARLFSSYPHCLMDADTKTTTDGATVWGNGNYSVNILKSEGVVRQSLIFLDGGDRVSKSDAKKYNIDKESYDFLKPSQIQWYKETINKLDDGVKSMLFVHIPLFEYQIAYDQAVAGDSDAILEYGSANEKVCSSQYNSGIFSAILQKESTQAVVAGHDHINDFRLKYKGVYLIYNQPSGYSSYNLITRKKGNTLLKGYSVYTINSDGSIDFNQGKNIEMYDHSEILKLYK